MWVWRLVRPAVGLLPARDVESLLVPQGREEVRRSADGPGYCAGRCRTCSQSQLLVPFADRLGRGAGGVRVGLTVRAAVVISPPSMIWPGSVDVAVRNLSCHGGHNGPLVKGSSVYAGARGCLRLRSWGVGRSDQGAAECAEDLAHEGRIRCSCLRFVVDGGRHLPRQCPHLVDREDEAQVRRGGVTPHLLVWDGFRLLPAVQVESPRRGPWPGV